MSISKTDAFQHTLCMLLETGKLSVAAVHKDKKTISFHKSFDLPDYSRDGIQDFLKQEEFTYDYDSYIAAVGGNRSTLIPVDLFNNTKAEDVFKLNFPEPYEDIDYNRIAEHGIVTVYELPRWMKSMFVVKFPRSKIVHPVTVLIKGIFAAPTYSPKIHLYITENSFHYLITSKNDLLFYNRFDFSTLADLVYHVLFVLEQKALTQDDFEVNLYGVGKDWQHYTELQGFFANKVVIADARESAQDFMLAKQLLCV